MRFLLCCSLFGILCKVCFRRKKELVVFRCGSSFGFCCWFSRQKRNIHTMLIDAARGTATAPRYIDIYLYIDCARDETFYHTGQILICFSCFFFYLKKCCSRSRSIASPSSFVGMFNKPIGLYSLRFHFVGWFRSINRTWQRVLCALWK